MRENETRIGGLQWGMFHIFEPSEPRYHRAIDQSVAAWRLASKKTGGSAFENPRSSVQRSVSLVTGGSNRANLEPQFCFSPPESDRSVPVIYRRARFVQDMVAPRPYDPEELARVAVRRRPMTAGEVQMRMEEERIRNPGFRYPTEAEVADIQRRFHNPELQHAMELAVRDYMARMTRMMTEPAPPGYREGLDAMRDLC